MAIPEKMVETICDTIMTDPSDDELARLVEKGLEAAGVGDLLYAIKDAQRRLCGAGMLGGDSDPVNLAYLRATASSADATRAAHCGDIDV
jgi:hypothetical protein